jgi:hypothetical protein
MAALAVATQADEVVASWETLDVATTCGVPPPHNDGRGSCTRFNMSGGPLGGAPAPAFAG